VLGTGGQTSAAAQADRPQIGRSTSRSAKGTTVARAATDSLTHPSFAGDTWLKKDFGGPPPFARSVVDRRRTYVRS